MKKTMLILAAAFILTACGGGSSTPTAIETVKEVFVPGDTVTVTEPGEVETVYVVQECPEVVEDAVETVTYYQISTATRDGENIQERVYDELGYLVSDYNEAENRWVKYAYDENHNQTSFIIERDGEILSYTYSTYDENSNQLTSVSDSGRSWIATYDDNNHRIRLEIDYGDGVIHTEVYTYEGDNQVKIEKLDENRTENKGYDINDNLIYSDIVINGETVQVETYTWQEFTEEI